MSLPTSLIQQATNLLSTTVGTQIEISRSEPVTAGWSGQFEAYPWITHCMIESPSSELPASVIVKVRRPAASNRSEPFRFDHERAALAFLTMRGCAAGPRLLAADDDMLIMEDLGSGPSLEDLLVGSDPIAAEQGLVAFATALGRMHASTSGHAGEYYQVRSRFGPIDPAFDRISILDIGIEHAWKQWKQIAGERSYLPAPDAKGIEQDIAELLTVLAEPGPLLAFSNGDTCPANCRFSDAELRFLDFEHAAFRHALLDVAALRFPFPACGCWSRLPLEVSLRAEAAYREQMTHSCPDVLDEAPYAHGLTVACAAWTIVRLQRLPKLERTDKLHPLHFSQRGQLLDTIAITLSCAQQSHSLPSFVSWLASVNAALRARWPHLATSQPLYPAFQQE